MCVTAFGIGGGGFAFDFFASDFAQPPQNLSVGWFTAPHAAQAPTSAPPHEPQNVRHGSFRRAHLEHATRLIVRDMPLESAIVAKAEGPNQEGEKTKGEAVLHRFAHNEPDRSTVRLSIPYAYA